MSFPSMGVTYRYIWKLYFLNRGEGRPSCQNSTCHKSIGAVKKINKTFKNGPRLKSPHGALNNIIIEAPM